MALRILAVVAALVGRAIAAGEFLGSTSAAAPANVFPSSHGADEKAEEKRIAVSSLERYTGSSLSQFQPRVIITTFVPYIEFFAKQYGDGKASITEGSSWRCAHSEAKQVSIINYNMGSPNAALVVDILARIDKFELVLFAGMVGGLPAMCFDWGCERTLQRGQAFVPTAAVRAEAVSDNYLPPNIPAVPDVDLLQAVLAATASGNPERGVVYTMNIRFWEFDEGLKAKIRASTADAIDMETATVFAAARKLGIKAAAFHLVSDQPFEQHKDKAMAKYIFEELAPGHITKAVEILQQCGTALSASTNPNVQRYMKARGH